MGEVMNGSAISATATMGNRMSYKSPTDSACLLRTTYASMMPAASKMPSTACAAMGTGSSTTVATWLTAPNTNENTARYDTAFTKSPAPPCARLTRRAVASIGAVRTSGNAETTMMASANSSSKVPDATKMTAATAPPHRNDSGTVRASDTWPRSCRLVMRAIHASSAVANP